MQKMIKCGPLPSVRAFYNAHQSGLVKCEDLPNPYFMHSTSTDCLAAEISSCVKNLLPLSSDGSIEAQRELSASIEKLTQRFSEWGDKTNLAIESLKTHTKKYNPRNKDEDWRKIFRGLSENARVFKRSESMNNRVKHDEAYIASHKTVYNGIPYYSFVLYRLKGDTFAPDGAIHENQYHLGHPATYILEIFQAMVGLSTSVSELICSKYGVRGAEEPTKGIVKISLLNDLSLLNPFLYCFTIEHAGFHGNVRFSPVMEGDGISLGKSRHNRRKISSLPERQISVSIKDVIVGAKYQLPSGGIPRKF